MQSVTRVGVGGRQKTMRSILLGRGDGQTRGLSLHAGLQPELDLIGLQTHQSD